MSRANVIVAGAFAIVTASSVMAVAGQTVKAPEMKPVLAGRKVVPPAKGEVRIERTAPNMRRTATAVITTLQVKNVGSAPIAQLTVQEVWFNATGANVSGNRASVDGLLQPGEVKTLTINTPFKSTMSKSSLTFRHANGTVKDVQVAKLVSTAPK